MDEVVVLLVIMYHKPQPRVENERYRIDVKASPSGQL
jgi:hypothetical protein